ncbi:hypothetical protein [Novosphingobium album (ex Hu et al. 2023)]|uniref:Uncharacterized protein n=1 Tax=Novosphingobium album (ex Hu et al. 2023) TaxID=2930093 RepID=A0ABT0B3T8_9SPHN|nr:hypothetical protein [Novosphingobium album (ex Hu et al. 2023)]MCJ2179711.1 hypothetical protein [Novosphingobium album (ex Hu et al. 2023)]
MFLSANALVLTTALLSRAWAQDPVALPEDADARDRAVSICMAEAKARGAKMGVVDVAMRKVEDTDKKSDGRASMRAEIDVVIKDKDGNLKTKRKTIRCDTRNGVVTGFRYD